MIRILDELAAFTGLPKATIETVVLRRDKWPEHTREWNAWKPETDAEVDWFYRASRTYLFSNARHPCPPVVLDRAEPGQAVLDFGGGAGSMTFPLAEAGCTVYYYDLNELQKAFVKFVAARNGLDIHVVEDVSEPGGFPLHKVLGGRSLQMALALDVLEHIPSYPSYVKTIAQSLMPGGLFLVLAPFDNKEPSHRLDAYGLDVVLRGNGLADAGKVRDIRLFRKEE